MLQLSPDSKGEGHHNVQTHTHKRTNTNTPFTGVTMHRNTKVTTSINTSHYEYCFQREVIHGIKTSTRVTPLARMERLKAEMQGHDWA